MSSAPLQAPFLRFFVFILPAFETRDCEASSETRDVIEVAESVGEKETGEDATDFVGVPIREDG